MWGDQLPCLGAAPLMKSSQQIEVHTHTQHLPVTRCSHGNSVRTALLSVIDSLLVVIFYSLHGTSAYGGL